MSDETKEVPSEEAGTPDYLKLSGAASLEEPTPDTETPHNRAGGYDAPAQEGEEETSTPAVDPLATALRGRIADLDPSLEVSDDWDADALLEAYVNSKAPKLNPELMAMQQALDSGASINDVINSFSEYDRLISMDDRPLFEKHIRELYGKSDDRPHGWDDDKIKQAVDKAEESGNLLFRAQEIRDDLMKHKKERMASMESFQAGRRGPDPSDPRVIKQMRSQVDNDIQALSDGVSVLGIDLGKPELKKAMSDRVFQLVAPDPKTGVSEFQKSLQSGPDYLAAAFLLDLYKSGQLGKLVFERVSKAKRGIVDALDQGPSAGGGRPGSGGSDKVDYDRLGRPSRIVSGK